LRILETDYLVVGSGPAGVSAAQVLVESGLQVTLIDSSDEACGKLAAVPEGTLAQLRNSGELGTILLHPDVDYLSHTVPDNGPKYRTPRGFNVIGGGQYPNKSNGIFIPGNNVRGGQSEIWGAAVPRYSDEQLSKMGLYPVEFGAHYSAVEKMLGSSVRSGSDAAHSGLENQIKPEIPDNILRITFRKFTSKKSSRGSGVSLEPIQNAVADREENGRQACSLCGRCLWGCPTNSIWSAAFAINELATYPNFRYRPSHVLAEVDSSSDNAIGRITHNGEDILFNAKKIILATGVVQSTSIVANSIKYSGKVRLHHNPVAVFLALSIAAGGRPKGGEEFGLAQLAWRSPLSDGDEEAYGLLYGANTLPFSSFMAAIPGPFAVRSFIARFISRRGVVGTAYLPSSFSNSEMIFVKGEVASISGSTSREAKAEFKYLHSALRSSLMPSGLFLPPMAMAVANTGTDAHFAGTMPHTLKNNSSAALTTDLLGRPSGMKNVHVVDGSVLPFLPAEHPTLTVMANSHRIASAII
jgi:choline dehydrogenase-like flavoprotein